MVSRDAYAGNGATLWSAGPVTALARRGPLHLNHEPLNEGRLRQVEDDQSGDRYPHFGVVALRIWRRPAWSYDPDTELLGSAIHKAEESR